jgi:hypothetical protein
MKIIMIAIFLVFLVTTVWSFPAADSATQLLNAQDAQRSDSVKANNIVGQTCQGSEVICVGDALGQCVNGAIVSLGPCGPGTKCQVLPLVNKRGTSTTCSTDADKQARFAAAGLNSNVSGAAGSNSNVSGAAGLNSNVSGAAGSNSNVSADAGLNSNVAVAQTTGIATKANDNICVDDTTFRKFTSATDFVLQQCPPGLCFTRNPPVKNPCIGRERALAIDGAGAG